ncbi:MAG TPA: HEAT repeat domain-containing protein [Pirellulaceae bacterium]|nr:HEAT repeat domain-containing protein [Pirellulaceae bacterium]
MNFCKTSRQGRYWSAAVVLLTGCGGSIADPPSQVQEAARTSLEQRSILTTNHSPQPRIEPITAPLADAIASSPRIRQFEEYSLAETADDALARIGPAAVPQVSSLLHASDPMLRRRAAAILARIGPAAQPAVPELIALLDDNDEEVRKGAARALGQIGPDAAAAVPALLKAAEVSN